ncbi:MAG: nucleotidyltransferase family protein [Bacteroidaceae bacterium]|nr:nucleotidyltransferase family protein [Bacteroidaceae bacterium]
MKNDSFSTLILAAGLGTRLKPLTDTMPKALVPVANKPLLEHLIVRLKANGCTDIVVNVHHFAQQIIDFLADKQNFGINIQISDEREQLLETGGAIKKAESLFTDGKPFLVHNVDIFHNLDLHAFYHTYSTQADAVLLVSQRDTQRYLLFNELDELVGWINIKTGEVKSPYPTVESDITPYRKLAFSGIHIFSPSLLPDMASWQDRFSIIDFYLQSCATHRIIGVEKDDLRLLDVGKINSLTIAEEFFQSSMNLV